jgi:hypothetical protein
MDSKEIVRKIERIKELKELGLNVPRFFYMNEANIEEALEWAGKITERNKDQRFNIRTYKYSNKRKAETVLCPHVLKLSYPDELKSKIEELLEEGYELMIDAEVPENGRISGNVSITQDPERKFYIFNFEYISKDYKAMVRDLNTEKDRSLVKSFELAFNIRYTKEGLIRSAIRLLRLRIAKSCYNYVNESYEILNHSLNFEDCLTILREADVTENFAKTTLNIIFNDRKEIPAFILVIFSEILDNVIFLSPLMKMRIEDNGIILEYTVFSVASGIMAEKSLGYLLPLKNLVFWEYRSY